MKRLYINIYYILICGGIIIYNGGTIMLRDYRKVNDGNPTT